MSECREDSLTSGKLLLVNCKDGKEEVERDYIGGEHYWWRWNHRDWVGGGKSFLELTNIELKKRDGQNWVGRKRILFFSESKTESRPRRKRKAQARL